MTSSKFNRILLTAFLALGICLAVFTGTALAGEQSCNCKVEEKPAIWTPESTIVEQGHSTGSVEREVSISAVKKTMHKRGHQKHVRYVVAQKEEGVHDSTCVDPTKQGWGFHVGDPFKNTTEGRHFWDHWKAGIEVCDWHFVKIGGHTWVEGTKSNCGNENIQIPINFHPEVGKIDKVVEFSSYAHAWTYFAKPRQKKVTTNSTSQSENVVHVPGHYSCASGWELVGTICRHSSSPCSCSPEPPCSCSPEPPCECSPPPCNCSEPPRIENEYKIQEVYTNEQIDFPVNVFAPTGDNLTILFVSEYGTFSPREIKVQSYGSQSRFSVTYTAPSEPVFDHVHVFVKDNTTGKTCKTPDQLVEVLEREENPS